MKPLGAGRAKLAGVTALASWSAAVTRRDPNGTAWRRAVRATIVTPVTLAVLLPTNHDQLTIFAVFATFALLVLGDYGGPMRSRAAAYVATGLVGAVLVLVGTAASDNAVAATLVTAVVGFTLTFVGVLGGYTAAVRTPLLLSVVLAASVQVPFSEMPDRVGGWLFGSALSLLAAMVVWPRRDHDAVLHAAARACDVFATIVGGHGDPGDAGRASAAARATQEVMGVRTAGASSRQRATAVLVEELDLFAQRLAPWRAARGRTPVPDRDADLAGAVAATLEETARALRGEAVAPDLTRLDRARAEQRTAVDEWAAATRQAGRSPEDVLDGLDAVRPLRILSHVAVTLGDAATVATGGAVPTYWLDIPPSSPGSSGARAVARRAWDTLRAHSDLRSVRFRDSLRAAVAFGLAVLIARLARLDHAFWAVLGSISVLRTSVTGAGRTAVQAIAGTVIGFVVVVPLMILVGDNPPGLWLLLPVAVAIAAYSSSTWPLAAGQAAFTVLVVVLFNLIEPTGWKVGAVRVLDVATGCLVALLVSLLFWPRGARAAVRQALAELFRASAAYLQACFDRALASTSRPSPLAAQDGAIDALRRAREALGDLLEERGPASPEATASSRRLAVGLGMRVAAERVNALTPARPVDMCPATVAVIRRDAASITAALGDGRPAAHEATYADHRRRALVTCLRGWDGEGDHAAGVLALVWISQWVLDLAGLADGLPAEVGVVATDGTGRSAGRDAVVGQIARHDGPGGDDDMATDTDAGQHDGAVPEP